MVGDCVVHLGRLHLDHIPAPGAEAAAGVDRSHPGIQRTAFDAVLVGILTLDLQGHVLAVGKSDQEVGDVFAPATTPQVVELEAEMVVLGVGRNIGALLQYLRGVVLPGAVDHRVADL